LFFISICSYVGDIIPITTNAGVRAIKDKKNMRVTLSLLYKTVYSNGREGKQGIFTMFRRAANYFTDAESMKLFEDENKFNLNIGLIKSGIVKDGPTVCDKPDEHALFISRPKPGLAALKYTCDSILHYTLQDSKYEKTVPHVSKIYGIFCFSSMIVYKFHIYLCFVSSNIQMKFSRH
jgi:hypothetical protein